MTARRGYAATSAGQVHYAMDGAGKPVILLGVAGRSSRMFHDLIDLLAGSMTAIAIDYPGSGGSDPIRPGGTIGDLAAIVVEVMDHLSLGSAAVFGLHTGNKVGSALAAGWPDRVDRFVLCGQTHSIIPSREARNQGIGDRVKFFGGDPDSDEAVLFRWGALSQRVAELWWPAKHLGEGTLTRAVELARRAVLDEIEGFDGAGELYRMNFAYDMEADWRRIRVPTLVLEIVTPREDALYGRQAEAVAAIIPGATTATIQTTGFKTTMEDQAAGLARHIVGFCA